MTHDPGGKRKPPWPTNSTVQAHFSDCELYRYSLSEIWDPSRPLVMFLLMNPSVAGIQHADPTLIKTGKFARAWGYGGQLIGNVHAYRATDSSHLVEAADPVGPLNDHSLLDMAGRAAAVILGYGLPPKALRPRAAHVLQMLRHAAPLQYLKLTKDGTPSHPLYLKDTLLPLSFPL